MDHSPLKLEEVVSASGGVKHQGARSSPACGIPGLQVARAALHVHLVPTMQGVERFTQVLRR